MEGGGGGGGTFTRGGRRWNSLIFQHIPSSGMAMTEGKATVTSRAFLGLTNSPPHDTSPPPPFASHEGLSTLKRHNLINSETDLSATCPLMFGYSLLLCFAHGLDIRYLDIVIAMTIKGS